MVACGKCGATQTLFVCETGTFCGSCAPRDNHGAIVGVLRTLDRDEIEYRQISLEHTRANVVAGLL